MLFRSLPNLDLSTFKTNNVKYIESIFEGCGIATDSQPAKGIAIDKATAEFFNDSTNTGIDLSKLRFDVLDNTSAKEISATPTLNIYTVTNSIIIETEVEMPISIVNASGVQVKSFVASVGTTTANDLPMGVYIVNNQKVLVGK